MSYLSHPVSITAGDTIDFAVGVGSNGNYNEDLTALSATIAVQAVHLDSLGLASAVCSRFAPSNGNKYRNKKYIIFTLECSGTQSLSSVIGSRPPTRSRANLARNLQIGGD